MNYRPGTTRESRHISNLSTHSGARGKVDQRVVALKEDKWHHPKVYIGHVVSVELPFVYSGAGFEESGESSVYVEGEGVAELDYLLWDEYQ